MYLTGLLQAFGVAFLMAIYNVYIKVCINLYDIKPLIFPGIYLLATAWIMLTLSGPGRFMKSTLTRFATWGFGFCLTFVFVLDIFLTKYISGTELAIVTRIAVPISMLLAYVFLKRKSCKADWLGSLFIVLSITAVLSIQDPNVLDMVIIGCIFVGLFEALNFFFTEIHKDSNEAHSSGNIRDRARVVSFSTFLTSLIFIILSLIVAFANDSFNLSSNENLKFLPSVDDIFHFPTIISAFVFGCLVSPFIRYFQWSASLKINTETVLTVLALCPIMTFALEYLASFIDMFGIANTSFAGDKGSYLFIVTILMTVGSLFAAYLKGYRHIQQAEGNSILEKIKNSSKIESENLAIGFSANNMADYEIIKSTVDFYEGDEKKAAEILELPLDTVKTLALSSNVYSLREDISQKVHNIFRNKIFYLDQLTGIENKKGLIRSFTELKDNDTKFSLYYMDINKFKQINDTLGHNVGDVALIETAKRLNAFAQDNNSTVFRLGGDEFAMLTTSTKTEEKIIAQLKHSLSQPINYNIDGKSGIIEPSISIGKAKTLKDDDIKIKDLIQSADENMYEDKKAFHAAT